MLKERLRIRPKNRDAEIDAKIDADMNAALGKIREATAEKTMTLEELERKIKSAGDRAILAIEQRKK